MKCPDFGPIFAKILPYSGKFPVAEKLIVCKLSEHFAH